MIILDAVQALYQLAVLIRHKAEEAKNNEQLCSTLSSRCERLIRILKQHPRLDQLDESLISKVFQFFTAALELVKEYGSTSFLKRFLKSSAVARQFAHLESEIEKCVDDIKLNIEVLTAQRLEDVHQQVVPRDAPVTEGDGHPEWYIDYDEIQFEIRRGMRKELGTGGFGRVYLASYQGSQVAVKEPLDAYLLTQQAQDEWRTELEIAFSMNHRNIVAVYGGGLGFNDEADDVIQWVNRPYMVMEYIESGSLASLLFKESRDLTIAQVCALAHGISSALAYLHAHSPAVIHRDLKPENVLLDSNLIPKLIDFGLAKTKTQSMRVSTAIRGSVEWMAPEQLLQGEITVKCDIYSLGLIISSMLTRARPFDASINPFQISNMITEGYRVPIPSNAPGPVTALIAECLARDATARPSASLVVVFLERFCREIGANPRADLLTEEEQLQLQIEALYAKAASATSASKEEHKEVSKIAEEETEFDIGEFVTLQEASLNMMNSVSLFKSSNDTVRGIVYGNKFILDAEPTVNEQGEGHVRSLGTCVFHIDATGSMGQASRMSLTVQVLHRVIPQVLRAGLRVIVNGWSSTQQNKGTIRTEEVQVDDEFLEEDKTKELEEHLLQIFKRLLRPTGKTDLYGSCFQLMEQCRTLEREGSGPICAFILTDGIQNQIDEPQKFVDPVELKSDYFGVFNFSGHQWISNGKQPNTAYCMRFLARRFQVLQYTSAVFVGIGEAETAFLQSLATEFGPNAKSYGITLVETADSIFDPSQFTAASDVYVTIGGVELKLHYTNTRADGHLTGSVTVPDGRIDYVHRADSISLRRDETTISMTANRSADSDFTYMVKCVQQCKSLPSQPYDCAESSLPTVFRQLVHDRQHLKDIRRIYNARCMRKFRQKDAYQLLDIWLEEIEQLIESQLTSYRQNFEDTVLKSFESDTEIKNFDNVAIERLQNNLRQAGMGQKRVTRLVTTVLGIRDKTMEACSSLLSRDVHMVAHLSDNQVQIELFANPKDREYSAVYEYCTSLALFEQYLKRYLSVRSRDGEIGLSSLSESQVLRVDAFPCVIVQAGFSPSTIIHTVQLFSLKRLPLDSENRPYIYCMQELWDLCRETEHTIGGDIPLPHEELESEQPSGNLVIPLAHTRLLFESYSRQGRVYASALNVTDNLLAMVPISLQWPKWFHDFFMINNIFEPEKLRAYFIMGLNCLASYARAIDSEHVPPTKESVLGLWSLRQAETSNRTNEDSHNSPSGSQVVSDLTDVSPTISYEDAAGITVYKAVSSLLVCEDVGHEPSNWNTYARTCFARMCEAVSGTKKLRFDPGSNRPDPGEFETEYRHLLGDLQEVLETRLQREWKEMSEAAKMERLTRVKDQVFELIQLITRTILMELGSYGAFGWPSVMIMISRALVVKRHGIETLLQTFEVCQEPSELLDALVQVSTDPSAYCWFPVFEMASDMIEMRPLTQNDLSNLLAIIEALVHTKVGPKVRDAPPVPVPAFPVYDTETLRALQVQCRNQGFDMSLPHVTLAFAGEVDAGKSTAAGQMLVGMGLVDNHMLQKIRAEASKMHHESYYLAWITDTLGTERARGISMERSYRSFQTRQMRFTVCDVPGHKDFAGNAALGIFQADLTVLMLSAVPAELEIALARGSQTREHCIMSFCFGIKYMIVAVNKLDTALESDGSFSQSMFENTKTKILELAKKCGFSPKNVQVLPVSALEGDNMVERTHRVGWFTGPTLLEALHLVDTPVRQVEKPFRMAIEQVFKVSGTGTVVCGRVESGRIRVGDSVSIAPAAAGHIISTVRSIQSHYYDIPEACPGENIGICVSGITTNDVKHGCMVGPASAPPSAVLRFRAQLILLVNKKHPRNWLNWCPTLVMHTIAFRARLVNIVEKLDRKTGQVLQAQDLSEMKMNEVCILDFECIKPVCMEVMTDTPSLAKFCVRENRHTIALGFVKSKLNLFQVSTSALNTKQRVQAPVKSSSSRRK